MAQSSKFRRILCWLGIHAWATPQQVLYESSDCETGDLLAVDLTCVEGEQWCRHCDAESVKLPGKRRVLLDG